MSDTKELDVRLRIERIEARLAKLPADLVSKSMTGAGAASLAADLRWTLAELRRARTDAKILREHSPGASFLRGLGL